ncbi:hypothetical protein LZD76_00865 [Lactobacillus mulieris]|uniref:hypothetical protein n=1 Tax=Lactobacillus mulieris TaxID=2508708 RepID=UPI0014329271|nr:hypothetical protein [Lactobacillus mulieris]MCF1783030.1 hypothetical protein [Lactobacillus mulieris]MCW8104576.1 hypothetical protein [Lactobacillus mulieris]MDK6803426.1 hypothetical protein [Lactobacillus mulieris]MDK8382399.1 hypothetical protein [Lactobacillus mulieris]MDT9620726.1 hypothetical protein [Lactobacillus mulieris]
MIRKHLVSAGITALAAVICICTALMWLAGLASPLVLSSTAILIILGVITGSLIPTILITWLIIGLTTIGAAILLIGYVVIDNSQKILLLLTYPLVASLTALAKTIIGHWGWIDRDRNAIESYLSHYDPVVKLQTTYNAAKLYHKEAKFIANEKEANLRIHLATVHWVHSNQFKQFHDIEYKTVLRRISKILKQLRFPSEQLYYIGNSTFLIISYALAEDTYIYKNRQTKQALEALEVEKHNPQFKWGTLKVDRTNVNSYSELEHALRHLTRDMETDLVVEYLKGAEING